MTAARRNRRQIATLTLGKIPRVVGTVLSSKFNPAAARWKSACDIVELRLDKMQNRKDWLQCGLSIESRGTPVIVTVRIKAEGGAWKRADKDRLPLYKQALKHLSAVDVELQSALVKDVCAMAKRQKKCCIVSFHDFEKTPTLPELRRVAARAQKLGSVIKITTMTRTRADVEILRSLLGMKWKKPLCVMGMGALGKETRTAFPKLGSCLTYGYLDKPAAPGQLSAGTLVRRLRKLLPEYRRNPR